MPLTTVLNWDNPSKGILLSGWTPFSSGSLSYEEEDSRVVMVYEDLRPGPVACCLLSCPPLIAFAPVFCPLLSVTSKAYHFNFQLNPKTQHYDLIMRTKLFACGGEDICIIPSVSHIRIETVHRVHSAAVMDGWNHTDTESSVTIHNVIVDYKDGSFTLPALPQDNISRVTLQALVSSVLQLVQHINYIFQDKGLMDNVLMVEPVFVEYEQQAEKSNNFDPMCTAVMISQECSNNILDQKSVMDSK